jgi:hypothetical protein
VGRPQYLCSGKAREATGEQVKVCLALFFVGNMKDSSRKRSRPTAPWARAEKSAIAVTAAALPLMYQNYLFINL